MAVVRQMVRDLNFGLGIVVGPTVREADGLALSSRNKYLTVEQRATATVLHRALRSAEAHWQSGERDSDALRSTMRQLLEAEPLARVDYVSAADPATLGEYAGLIPPGAGALLSMAVFFDRTRLIDNVLLSGDATT